MDSVEDAFWQRCTRALVDWATHDEELDILALGRLFGAPRAARAVEDLLRARRAFDVLHGTGLSASVSCTGTHVTSSTGTIDGVRLSVVVHNRLKGRRPTPPPSPVPWTATDV